MTRLGLALVVLTAGGCQPVAGVVPDRQMELHANNGTPLQLAIVVDGQDGDCWRRMLSWISSLRLCPRCRGSPRFAR